MPTTGLTERCPHCGSDRALDVGIDGLCPSCLLSLALHRPPPTGDRYQIRELLGRGGMGEVYRALDLKLCVDVALKAVRPGHTWNEQARELLRREVRSAREVVSSNVCRIFDLVDQEGQELLSMEYVDGETLGETLRSRGPLVLSEAREIASQFLSGLDAIHGAGLVHRDFKPENVMITRAGRVVVMDFGVARAARGGAAGTISGTPAYMAPEQARGEEVDARADVFSAGVVLAEMISVGGRDLIAAREALWRAVRSTPPLVPEGPWAAVLQRALAARREERYSSARELARALEEVTLPVPGLEPRRPYPGLQAFSEQDADYFFGREIEVESVWKKLERPHLLGLIGPSGAGKSSFVRAGLLPALPSSWKAVVTTPGTRPFQRLAEALVPQFADDAEASQTLLRFGDADTAVEAIARWRSRYEHTLVIVDQFEELFSQNEPAVRSGFAQLIGRMVLEADTHVIVSLRDDFLVHCQAHEALAPMTKDLTILGPLGDSGLRRALVQPALACGYHFEDEALVQEMIEEVAHERGALPLLAFAASRLWDLRDREEGLLTWAAYRRIGGVAGALAQHAESTLEKIGERIPIVRELFRNLVTSQGTRAVRGRADLLSVFARDAGSEATAATESVLNSLIDARLLTTYERAGDEGERLQQVEIIHESLLSAWPRLVRWRTQDADGAQLRDQLRQAAQLWHERGQLDDLLWSGIAYRDLSLWRERYPGRLSATEEAFADAARRGIERRRRRRQLAGAALFTAVVVVAVTLAVLWRQSEAARQQATAESLRAEAGKLQVTGERELLRYPTGALAYVLKSLELADTESARLLALRLLQQAPVARIARVSERQGNPKDNWAGTLAFSPTGDWVGWAGNRLVELAHRDGRRLVLDGFASRVGALIPAPFPAFSADGRLVVADYYGDIRVWSIPDGRELYRGSVEEGVSLLAMGDGRFFTLTNAVLHEWPLPGGPPRRVGAMLATRTRDYALDVSRTGVAYVADNAVYFRSTADWNAPPRRLFEQSAGAALALTEDGSQVATGDLEGTIRIAPTGGRAGRVTELKSPEPVVGLYYGPAGRWLAAAAFERGHPSYRLFDLAVPPGAEPLLLQKGDTTVAGMAAFAPLGRWLVTAHGPELAFWPLTEPRARIFRGTGPASAVMFDPGWRRFIYIRSANRTVRTLPMDRDELPRVLFDAGLGAPLFTTMAMSGQMAAVTGGGGRVSLLRLDDGSDEQLAGFPQQSVVGRPAFSPDGRLLAAGMASGPRDQKVIRVWNLREGTSRAYGPWPAAGDVLDGGIPDVAFAGPDRLLASVRGTGLVSVDLASGATRVVVPQAVAQFVLSPDGRFGVATRRVDPQVGPGHAIQFSLHDGSAQVLQHGSDVRAIAMDPSGSLVATGSQDGSIRVSRTTADAPPHLLLGQEGAIYSLAFSTDGRWLAASGEAFDIRVWPVPDVARPPVHLLSRDRFLNLLRSHTNLRAVRDAASPGGYRLTPDAFPGWSNVPEW